MSAIDVYDFDNDGDFDLVMIMHTFKLKFFGGPVEFILQHHFAISENIDGIFQPSQILTQLFKDAPALSMRVGGGMGAYLFFANMNTGDFGFSLGDIDDDGKFLIPSSTDLFSSLYIL